MEMKGRHSIWKSIFSSHHVFFFPQKHKNSFFSIWKISLLIMEIKKSDSTPETEHGKMKWTDFLSEALMEINGSKWINTKQEFSIYFSFITRWD